MGALVAAVSKKKENVVPIVVTMLKELIHRGKDGHGIATPTSVITRTTIEEIELNDYDSTIALGYNLSVILPRDQLQPVQGDGFAFVFEGRLFPSPNLSGMSEVKEIAGKLSSDIVRNSIDILEKLDGSFVFAFAESNRLIAGREIFGVTPLYYGENETICAIASERKALWKIGIENVLPFLPGHLAVIDVKGFSFFGIKDLRIHSQKKLNIETGARALELLLLESTRKQVSDLERVAVAFSGGVDSCVVADLAENVGLDVQLISVCMEDKPELIFAEEAAKELDLPIHLQTYTTSNLKEILSKVLWLIEEPNPINVCIAIPFYWLAETASKLGHPVLLAGQGADELFGGYQRYLKEYTNSGTEIVEKRMFFDIKNAHSVNFQRDNKVCSYHGVELRMPFINIDVVDFSLRLPLQLKINSIEDRLRKRVLRKVASNREIPSLMADKPKKAIQYSTGVTKALQQLARSEGFTLKEYVKHIFNIVYPSVNSNKS
jgi:asparagine synthase (glutamine-hydrolysing)